MENFIFLPEFTYLIILFSLGYLIITLEKPTKTEKLIPALLMGAGLWLMVNKFHLPTFEVDIVNKVLEPVDAHIVKTHHLGKATEILVFLMCAMTIVAIIEYFKGFNLLVNYMNVKSKSRLTWVVAIIAFLLSAVIDNLTATIVLVVILRKILDKEDLIWYASMVVIAANAGGAWSPVGDVTTTMLWVENLVNEKGLVINVFLPSIAAMVIPVLLALKFIPNFQGDLRKAETNRSETTTAGNIIFFIGLSMIIFVPIYKIFTHEEPYMGMMIAISVVAIVAEILSRGRFHMGRDKEEHHEYVVLNALPRIEMGAIFFFIGILMAVAALESVGLLYYASSGINEAIPNTNIVIVILGFISAILDNVPLVAASMGMFPNEGGDFLWNFLAYCAGVGGSMFIIGSAAGVIAMTMAKIDIIWYLRKMSWLALAGYIGGIVVFYIQYLVSSII